MQRFFLQQAIQQHQLHAAPPVLPILQVTEKLRELADVLSDLKEVFEFSQGGDVPIHSQGSRWISHKHQALQQVMDCYGAYITHLIILTEDSLVSSTDKARLKGYLLNWQQGKMLIGCTMYVDAVKSPSILSKVVQGDKVDIVLCL